MFIDVFKDYVDYLHSLSDLITGDISILVWIKGTIIYVTKSTFVLFWYIISFKWLFGFAEIPALVRHTYSAILESKSVFDARLELSIDQGFFSFIEGGRLNSNNIGTGLLNSFFLALPLSVPQLFTLRAFLVNGVPAAMFSALGTIVGQFSFFVCVLFGLEFFLVPWLSIQPLLILVGSGIVLHLIYKMIHKPLIGDIYRTNRKLLFKFFRVTLVLSWFEQICIFGYTGNLTLTNSPSVFQTADTNFLFSTVGYLLGLTIGTIIWTVMWAHVSLFIRDLVYKYIFFNYSWLELRDASHYFFVQVIAVFCLASYPYYGFDFLAGASMGFVSDDKGLEMVRTSLDNEIPEFAKEDNYFEKYKAGAEEDEGPDNMLYRESSNRLPVNPGTYELESYNFDVERRWKNRELERTRITEESKKKQLNPLPIAPIPPIYIDRYESPVLMDMFEKEKQQKLDGEEPEEETEDKDKPKERITPFDAVTDAFARTDIYTRYIDASHEDYSPEVEVHYTFRKKFFANPVYKALLRLDMYPFLLGANKYHNLSPEDEYNLYQNRLALQGYANSVLSFDAINKNNEMTFSRRVYNHQFKGSLNVVRLFKFAKVHENLDRDSESEFYKPDETERLNKRKVLKYDQLLYNTIPNQQDLYFHEEIKVPEEENLAALEIGNQSSPMYIGWDGARRKFMVKTRVSPSEIFAGDETYTDPHTVYNEPDLLDEDGEPYPKLEPEDIALLEKNTELYFPKENSKIPKGIPTYYSFQAWSPAVENNIKPGDTSVNSPGANYTEDEMYFLKLLLKQMDPTVIDPKNQLTSKQQEEINDIFEHLPNYDWYWKRVEPDFVYNGYFCLGNTTPPQLDGFAWPGVRDPILIDTLLDQEEINRNEYLSDEEEVKSKDAKKVKGAKGPKASIKK